MDSGARERLQGKVRPADPGPAEVRRREEDRTREKK